jgi:predicted Zn-dependent protease
VEQEHIRRLGMKMVPQYQRDLPVNDPAKIPFRFYAVEEQEIRSAIFCGNGLVLVPVEVMNRLQNEDQLAAVLADGVAGVLQQQVANARRFTFTLKDAEESAAYALLVFAGPLPEAGGLTVLQKVNSNVTERERGRMALAFMTDAGFDPRQAPEAWRLLAPGHLPKDRAKLKYPERSRYLQYNLDAQSKAKSGDPAPEADHTAAVTPSS